MNNKSVIAIAIIIIGIGGVYYLGEQDIDLSDFNLAGLNPFQSQKYSVKIYSNTSWSTLIRYKEDGDDRQFIKFTGNNKTYEISGKLTYVNIQITPDYFNPDPDRYVTLQVYQGKKLLYEKTTHRLDYLVWRSGIEEA